MNTSPLLMIVLVQSLFVANAASPQLKTKPPVILNETPSMAEGAYLRVGDVADLKSGDIIAMPMNSAARNYLGNKLGYPKDTMLIKRVAGLSGDLVCRHNRVVTINKRTLAAARSDRQGNLLQAWNGCRTLSTSEVFILGDHPASFDSRYIGPVSRSELAGIYRAAITW
ncbi:S26 family signal peptidase [Aquidulcibacter paucihalophilus]|uniref:S26 family signal peptidase n=1 Tax=Aquidulcibacter paucihalophilus TaxID=1978549 RepID=UPI000A18F708|nr:S26 family signal peptidase [Aquidulcibacter paucihalophilus]